MRGLSSGSHPQVTPAVQGGRVPVRPVLIAASVLVLLAALVGGWLLLRPVDPAGSAVPAPITVPERSAPGTTPPEPTPDPAPTDVVPPPPIDDDDDDDEPDDDPDEPDDDDDD